MEKRGQVTIFIILGIVILSVIGVVYLVYSNQLDYYLGLEKNKVSVPGEILPVQLYLEGCLSDTVSNGLSIMGRQAGYLELDTVDSFDSFSNVLETYPGYKIPYWYYEDLNGEPREQVPTINVMEKQLQRYVEIGFQECLLNLDEFRDQGFEINIQNKQPKAEIRIEREFVEALVRMPMDVSTKDVGINIPRHSITEKSSYGKLYEKAKQLYEDNNKELWLENKTLSYIYTYTEELPHYDVEFTCNPLIWKVNDIEENYKEILELNVPFYLVKGSEYDSYYETENSLVWDAGPGFNDVQVNFEYDRRWPFEIDISDAEGGVLISQPLEGGIPVIDFCTNTYNFFYDVKHPVLINLRDSSGEEFSFANQIILRNSEPRKQIDLEEIEFVQYCDIREGLVDVNVEYVNENNTFSPVDEASLYYKCINHICYLGDTDSSGKFEGSSPSCIGGILEVRKDGFKPREENLDVFGNQAESLFINLDKFKELNYEFKVYDLVNNKLNGPRNLKSNEKVLLQIENLENNEIEGIGFYPDDDTRVKIGQGLYGITTKLILDGSTTLESKEVSQCSGVDLFGACIGGETSIKLDSVTISNPVLGGSYVEDLFEGVEIERSDKVIFYVINVGTPITYDDINRIYDHKLISLGFEEELKPEFK